MLAHASERQDRYGQKQRLFLACALQKAYGLPGPDLTGGRIRDEDIAQQFDAGQQHVKKHLTSLTAVFERLENQDKEEGTRPYWALTHAIAFFMLEMCLLVDKRNVEIPVPVPHASLIRLIDRLLSHRYEVAVVDFNYDCVLETETWERPSIAHFGWDCGRERHVIARDSEGTPLSELVKRKRFQPPLDAGSFQARAELIKPHGDMCTFLRGSKEVYYRGGRHSHTTSAIFPARLADISDDDWFVRSSILPPSRSRYRHRAAFYEQEASRFENSLVGSDIIIVIGWSGMGADDYYEPIFERARRTRSSRPRLVVINKALDDQRGHGECVVRRLSELFDVTIEPDDLLMDGFTEVSVRTVEGLLLGK